MMFHLIFFSVSVNHFQYSFHLQFLGYSKLDFKQKSMRKYQLITLLLLFLLQITVTLSGKEVKDKCHCNLIAGFCQPNCCCDTDCTDAIPQSCFLQNSTQVCIEPKNYFRINANQINSNYCYYYNTTDAVQQQVQLGFRTRSALISENSQKLPVNGSLATIYKGYQRGSTIKIGESTNLYMVNLDGSCTSSGQTSTRAINLNFKRGMQIICTCTNCDNTINLYSAILDKAIPQFLGIESPTIKIPTSIPADTIQLTVNIIVGKYGTKLIDYIQTTTIQTKVGILATAKTRKLLIKFIDSSQVTLPQENPTFFPQIPIDIFYPIYMS